MATNPFEVLGIPAEAVAHLDHNELQVLLALRKKIEDSRHREMQQAIEAEGNAHEHSLSDQSDLTAAVRGRGISDDSIEDCGESDELADDSDWEDARDSPAEAVTRTPELRHDTSSLVPVDTELARYRLVVREVVRESETSAGVSLGWLTKKASELSLSRDELEELMAARRDFRAGMPALMRAVTNGIAVPDLYHLYRVREEAASVFDGPTFSIKWIHEFCETFPEAQVDDEGLAEVLIDAYHEVHARVPWMWKYPDDALQLLTRVATGYGVNNIESCLLRIGPRRDGDDSDEEDQDNAG